MPLFKWLNGGYWELKRNGLQLAWVNAAGGFHDFQPSYLNEVPLCEAASRADLRKEENARRILGEVLCKTLDLGWICPKGNFYGCYSEKHNDLADALEMGWRKIEEQGGIKIAGHFWRTAGLKKITRAQERTLEKIGRSADRDQYRYRDETITYEAAFPKGNKSMDALIAKYEAIVEAESAKRKPLTLTSEQVYRYL